MNSKIEKIISALNAMRSDSMQCPPTETGFRALINKYDMMFLGRKFNSIYSMELCHCLKDKFNIDIELEELNQMIPEICTSLHMDFEPMREVNDLSNPKPAAYNIILY